MQQTNMTVTLPCSRATVVHTYMISSTDFSQFAVCLPSSSVSKVAASVGRMTRGQFIYEAGIVLFVSLF